MALPDLTNSISPLLVIAGPTAGGKSALALELARRWGGEIVNGDSVQIYRGMDIGTAKPKAMERAQVPHHLFDVRNPNEVFSAGEYSRLAREVVAEIAQRGKLPIVVGGAGFYLKALVEGLSPGAPASEEIRQRLLRMESKAAGRLHRVLRCWAREAAEQIHRNDTQKIVRALEIMLQEKKRLQEARIPRDRLEGYRVLWMGVSPPRDRLRARILERAREMFAGGLLEEVRQLREQGYGQEAKAMESVGYRQAQQVWEGKMTVEEAVAETGLRSGQYAKRQMTWFRRNKEMVWLEGFGHDIAIQAQAESVLKQFLTGAIKIYFDERNK